MENSHFRTFPDDETEIITVCLSVLLNFVINYFNLFNKRCFYNKFYLNLNGLSDGNVVLFTKNENKFLA